MKYAFSSTLTACLAATAITGQALAADLNTGTNGNFVEPQFDPVANSSIWSGVYAGLYGGLKWRTVGVMGSDDIDLSNKKEFGGYVGINQELGSSIVGGLEWTAGYSGAQESENGVTAEQDWETSLRARMGFAVEQNLIYGLAGLSAAHLDVSEGGDSDQRWLTGWTVGAGIERQLTENIVGRVEYDYSSYGEQEFDLGTSNPDIDLTGHGLKVGLGLQF